MDRNNAIELLKNYNKEPFHILHGLTVGGVMKWFAKENGEDECYWETVGILHDIDFEMWPEEHCKKAPELLKEAGVGEDIIYSVCSHGYGRCSTQEPLKEMEKVLFAADELTGIVNAAAKMRPSGSCKDMELKSLKKKFKSKGFAAGCDRDTIRKGAEMLGWDLDTLLNDTLEAMKSLPGQ